MDRRTLLGNLAGASCFALPFQAKAAYLTKKVKITDVKVMIVRGPTWDWNLFKIETDAGVHGIGEGYWGPGAKDITLKRFREQLVGEDPMNVVKLYTKLLFLNGGYGATGGLTLDGGEIMGILTSIRILHKGYTKEIIDALEKSARNLPLLAKAVAADENDPFALFNFS